MTVTYRGDCPECDGIAAFTVSEHGTGHSDPIVNCACQERLALPTDTKE